MIHAPIALAGVSRAYVAAFRDWADLRNSVILMLEDDGPALPGEENLALCAVELSGDRAGCMQRLRAVRKRAQRCPVVVLGSGISVDTAVALLREGACDVIELPAPPADVVACSLVNAADSRCNGEALDLVGNSPAIRELRREIDHPKVAEAVQAVGGPSHLNSSGGPSGDDRSIEQEAPHHGHGCAAQTAGIVLPLDHRGAHVDGPVQSHDRGVDAEKPRGQPRSEPANEAGDRREREEHQVRLEPGPEAERLDHSKAGGRLLEDVDRVEQEKHDVEGRNPFRTRDFGRRALHGEPEASAPLDGLTERALRRRLAGREKGASGEEDTGASRGREPERPRSDGMRLASPPVEGGRALPGRRSQCRRVR